MKIQAMGASALALSIAFAPAALAGDMDLMLNAGMVETSGDAWEVFDAVIIDTVGIGGSYRLSDQLAATIRYDYGEIGANNDLSWDEWYDVEYQGTPGAYDGFIAAFWMHRVGAGVRFEPLEVKSIKPFVMGEADATWALVRLDDDAGTDENVNQIEASSTSFGGALSVGMAWEPVKAEGDDSFSLRLEARAGAGFGTAFDFAELGQLELGNVRMSFGAGMSF